MVLRISKSAFISNLADIEDSVRGSIIEIGSNSMIDSFVKIKAAGGSGDIKIGENVQINSSCVLYIGNGITIGSNTAIGAGTVFAPTNHSYSSRTKLIKDSGFLRSKGGIIVGNDCWIASHCVLLDGAVIGEGSVIGAMSLVRETIPPYSIGYGNPFKIVGVRN